jgi:hypothetical protein
VAALVLGVAAVSFILFPLGPLEAWSRRSSTALPSPRQDERRGNPGEAVAGIVCRVLALVVGAVFAVRFGTFEARNISVFTTFDNCIAKIGNRKAVSSRIAASRTTSGPRIIPARPVGSQPCQLRRSPIQRGSDSPLQARQSRNWAATCPAVGYGLPSPS